MHSLCTVAAMFPLVLLKVWQIIVRRRSEEKMVILIHNIQTEGETSQDSREHFGISKL